MLEFNKHMKPTVQSPFTQKKSRTFISHIRVCKEEHTAKLQLEYDSVEHKENL